MMRRIMSVTVVILALSAQLLAHDEFRIVGTVVKLENFQLQVKSRDTKVWSVALNTGTFIHKDKDQTKVSETELKAGTSVVVDALGDTEFDLQALEVRIVPAIGSPGK